MKSIFDLVNENLVIDDELQPLINLFSNDKTVGVNHKDPVFGDLLKSQIEWTMSFEEYINKYIFLKWKYHGRFESVNRYKENIRYYDYPLIQTVDEECFVNTLEYIYTLMKLIDEIQPSYVDYSYNKDTYDHIISNIEFFVSKTNKKIEKIDPQQYRIYENNINVKNAVKNAPNKDTAIRILEYGDSINKGNLNAKKDILKNFADEFEADRIKLERSGYQTLAKDLGFLFNSVHIRHNNKKGQKEYKFVQEMSNDELEKWYDRTYELYLIAVSAFNSLEMKDELDTIKNKSQIETETKKTEKKARTTK